MNNYRDNVVKVSRFVVLNKPDTPYYIVFDVLAEQYFKSGWQIFSDDYEDTFVYPTYETAKSKAVELDGLAQLTFELSDF